MRERLHGTAKAPKTKGFQKNNMALSWSLYSPAVLAWGLKIKIKLGNPLAKGDQIFLFQEADRCCAHSGPGDTRFSINIGPELPAVYNYSGQGRGKPNLCGAGEGQRTRGAADRGAGLPRGAEACRAGRGRLTTGRTDADRQAGRKRAKVTSPQALSTNRSPVFFFFFCSFFFFF